MRYPDYQTIDIQMDGNVCIVSLNKPEIRNALMEEMREELKNFFLRLVMIVRFDQSYWRQEEVCFQRVGI